jgi:hypothetical protein
LDLTERLLKLETPAATPRTCPVRILLDSMTPSAREVFERVLANGNISGRSIHDELRASEVRIGRESIMNHRNNKCACQEKV